MFTSIIIPVHNQLEYTRLAIDSIQFHTPEPHEIIVVDNASSDGTAAYVRGLRGVTLVTNTENRGHPGGTNDGTRRARGDLLVWLNNDVVATPRWLRNLQSCLASDPRIGVCSPMTNYIGNPGQLVKETFPNLNAMQGFASTFNRSDPAKWVDDMLFGFCFALPRRTWDLVGPLNEETGLGLGDDIDYVERVRAAGLRAVIAGDTFLYHFGSRTFFAIWAQKG